MKRHDILKALRRIRKALFPGERYELIIHTPDGMIVKYVGRKVPVTLEREEVTVGRLAEQVKNRMLNAKFIPEKNSAERETHIRGITIDLPTRDTQPAAEEGEQDD